MLNFFNELRKQGKLAAKRHPMYDKNKFGKFLMYIGLIFWAGYLVFFGISFAFALDTNNREAYHLLNGGLIIILALDFMIRFPFQKTPTQEVKPYLLLPVKRNRVIDFLLIRSGLDGFNFFWLFLFVPFAIISVTKFFGIWGVITYCLGIWLLMIANNFWYLLCRTLLNERILWLFLPIAVYGGLACAIFIPDNSPILDFSMELGDGFITGNILTFIGVIATIALFWWINRKVMSALIYNELNKVEDTKANASEYKFFERYGEVGEYMRLEIKMLFRNKSCKNALRTIFILVIIFSCTIAFTEIYDAAPMRNFFTVYNFSIFGILFIINIMSYEGNYMDGLMSRKESIYVILRAKYILYSIAMIIPFILMTPAMIMKKIEIFNAFSWVIFTAGFIYFGLFQLAVYNSKAVPLNLKLASRQNTGSALQNIISFAALGTPLIIFFLFDTLFGGTATSWILMAIGAVFIITSHIWLKNIYHRFMKRRYQNLEGFRESRER